jgi:hypothetical protein
VGIRRHRNLVEADPTQHLHEDLEAGTNKRFPSRDTNPPEAESNVQPSHDLGDLLEGEDLFARSMGSIPVGHAVETAQTAAIGDG